MSEVIELVLDKLDTNKLEKLLKDLEVKEERKTGSGRA